MINKDSLGTVIVITLTNCVCVICWAALAVIFNRWWIALFALLFMTYYKTARRHYRICDKCSKHSPPAESREAAIQTATGAGWFHRPDSDVDFCPDCKYSEV